jgi:cyclase
MSIRLIPRLDIKGPNLVKGVHLEGLRVLGKPEEFARRYYQEGADELLYIDLVASLYGRSNLKEIVSRTAEKICIPLTVGGGLRTVEDMRVLLRAGADKVAINTALFEHPSLLSQGAKAFGSQCMVLYVEAKKKPDGKYTCLHTNAREDSGREVVDWVREAVDRGAGEILLTSEDAEGTGTGYDLELLQMVNEAVDVPVIVSGGAGTIEHLIEGAKILGTGAVSAASMLHYYRLEEFVDSEKYNLEGNTSFIELARSKTAAFLEGRIQPTSIANVKTAIAEEPLECRPITPILPFPCKNREVDVAVVDYGVGNLFSLRRAVQCSTGKMPVVTDDPATILNAEKVILPGVGAFGDGMNNLRERGLISALIQRGKEDRPLLGICLGMQLLLSKSFEFGEHEGLGLIPGVIEHIFNGEQHSRLPVPHIGWASLCKPESLPSWQNTILEEVQEKCYVYFVHTFVARPANDEAILATALYGPKKFVSAVRSGNICGCQFHPELSGPEGLTIIENFLNFE